MYPGKKRVEEPRHERRPLAKSNLDGLQGVIGRPTSSWKIRLFTGPGCIILSPTLRCESSPGQLTSWGFAFLRIPRFSFQLVKDLPYSDAEHKPLLSQPSMDAFVPAT